MVTGSDGRQFFFSRFSRIVGRIAFLACLGCMLFSPSPALAKEEALPQPFEENDLWGYALPDGQVVIPPRYIAAFEFSAHGLAAVIDDQGWVMINLKGEHLLRPFVFDNGPDYFSEGLARFEENGKMGFFDESGTKVIPARYDFVEPFCEGLAVYCCGCEKEYAGEHYTMTGGLWGYIDKQGQEMVPCGLDRAEEFHQGSARAVLQGKDVLVMPDGTIREP